jgi:hypothetical protein
VAALIRRVEQAGSFAVVARKGDARAGAVLIKVLNLTDAAVDLYAEAMRGDGERIWMRPIAAQGLADLDRYVERSLKVDPDLWVVEIEDKQGRHFLTEPVEAG